jgi:hypothetical protein
VIELSFFGPEMDWKTLLAHFETYWETSLPRIGEKVRS